MAVQRVGLETFELFARLRAKTSASDVSIRQNPQTLVLALQESNNPDVPVGHSISPDDPLATGGTGGSCLGGVEPDGRLASVVEGNPVGQAVGTR